jgi:adenosylmethionine-8-amino-7-oxononanoate aminotransferase
VFFADSGSVAVEVAIKMALQYWMCRQQPERKRLLSLRSGYHGDTFGAMSVCDPVTGMHELFTGALMPNLFAPRPNCRFGELCTEADFAPFRTLLEENHPPATAPNVAMR